MKARRQRSCIIPISEWRTVAVAGWVQYDSIGLHPASLTALRIAFYRKRRAAP
jgi:hypothetical protein